MHFFLGALRVNLTVFILIDNPIHIDMMELSNLYFKGLPVKISAKLFISVLEDCFYLGKQYLRVYQIYKS